MPGERILVVDDDASLREVLATVMRRESYDVATATTGEDALISVQSRWPALVLTDLNMPGMSGLDLLRSLKALAAREGRDVAVVMITAYATAESAVAAMKEGASDYVTKPFNNEELRVVARKALGQQELEVENARLRRELQDRHHFGNLVGASPAMGDVYELIRRVKDTRINCLILGESGTGKEMVARSIHYSGARSGKPFVAVNCGAIPENLVESELFGHKKGSFTGAIRDKQGLMSAADGGTLFLDEVASLPLSAQVTLLRALQERRFTPVGDVREVAVDVRIIAACNVDLEECIRAGSFREDLYYRLNVVQLVLPPLRERKEDLPALVRHFVERFGREYGKQVTVSAGALRLIEAWSFPGNVRELQNLVERAVALCAGPVIDVDDLPVRLRHAATEQTGREATDFPSEGIDLDEILSRTERDWLTAALSATGGNKTRAAELLNMSFRSFRYRLAKYGMSIDD